MFRKLVLSLVLGLGIGVTGLIFGQSHAFACGNGVCGYFKNGNDSAWCNVLPDTGIRWGAAGGDTYYPDYCWLNFNWGTGHSRLFGVNNTGAFINDIKAYLNENSGTAEFKNNSNAGGAFIIDDMLGRDKNNGNTGTGINDAKAQFGNWSNEVNALGANQCATNNGTMVCPGKSFGINWKYVPPNFCSNPTFTSAYDPFGAFDTPIYNTDGNCAHDWSASIPEIVFYWNNGANSFHIGSQCGNVQSRADKLPTPDRLPTGTIAVVCNKATWQQDATVNFSDPDGATDGFVTINGINVSGTIGSGTVVHIPQSDTNPYPPSQVVTLHIRDSGPSAPPGTYVLVNANTDVPCASLSCGFVVTPASELDPYMGFSVQVVVNNNVNLTPAGTIGLQITPPVGAVYNFNGSQAVPATVGPTTSATFNGLGPTNNTGQFNLSGSFNGGGISITCTNTFPVVYLPYLNVYGGDVQIGASPGYNAGASSCYQNTAAGIFSWDNVGGGYYGAGTQYAVQVLGDVTSPGSGQIRDFSSAQGSSNTPPIGLAYANTGLAASELNPGQGLYGGYSGLLTGDCDFTKDLTIPPTNADVIIGATTVNPGSTPVYVTGHDVYITGNITYAGVGGWGPDPAQIPYFKLIVTNGDIYIGSGVTQLDGLFVAESNAGINKGRIFTCATGLRLPANPAAAGYYNLCKSTLTINGAFVAKQVQFLRTPGSVGQATDGASQLAHSAEVFNYTPELWLPRAVAPANSGYTAITGLPPIL